MAISGPVEPQRAAQKGSSSITMRLSTISSSLINRRWAGSKAVCANGCRGDPRQARTTQGSTLFVARAAYRSRYPWTASCRRPLLCPAPSLRAGTNRECTALRLSSDAHGRRFGGGVWRNAPGAMGGGTRRHATTAPDRPRMQWLAYTVEYGLCRRPGGLQSVRYSAAGLPSQPNSLSTQPLGLW